MLVQTQTPLDLRASLRLKPHWTTLALAKAIHSGKLKAHFHTGIPVPCGTSDLFHTWVRVDDFKEYAARFHVDVSVGGIASKPDELKSIAAKGASASAPVAYKVEAAKSSDWKEQARAIADECFDHDTKMNCRDSLNNYSQRVMDKMQERGIKGARGIIDNANTIKREALQGKRWWANKDK